MKYVFFTGMGRSGTKFLTSLLKQSPGVNAVHEYIGNREFWLLSWYLGGEIYAEQFLQKEKLKIENTFKADLFIDINGYLQNSVPELNAVFKPVKIFHLVRNPTDVVRSLYTRRNDADVHIIPKNKNEIHDWIYGDKFTQICWNWANTTKLLLEQQTELIIFEKVISDYQYFQEKILIPLNIAVSKSNWEMFREEKINKTMPAWYRNIYAQLKGKTYIRELLPEYNEWTTEQKVQFNSICGKLMKECGYV